MASEKRRSVWGILARLGHTGDRDDIIERVFESASRVTVRSDDGEPMDGGDFLVEVFESLGTTKDWPVCGSREWIRLREIALRRIVARLAREGLLDAITGTGTRAPNDEDAVSWINTKVAGAMLRRVDRNPEGWSKCVKRDTPLRVIVRWSSEVCPNVPEESLAALAKALRGTAWTDEDGHLLGSVMLDALEAELETGRDEQRWILVVSDFHAAIDALRGVLERLSLL